MKNYKWLVIFILVIISGSFLLYKYISSNTITNNRLITFLQNDALCYKYINNGTTRNQLLEFIPDGELLEIVKLNGYIVSYHSPQQRKIISTVWIPLNSDYSLKKDTTITGEWTKSLLTIKTNENKNEFAFAGKNFVALSSCGSCLVEITKHLTLQKDLMKNFKNNTLYGNIENINQFLSYKNQTNILLKLISKGKFSITKQGNKNGLFYQAKIDSIKPITNNSTNKFPQIITRNTVVAITLNLTNENTYLRINNSTNQLWDIEEKYQINIREAFKAWFTGTISYVLFNNINLSEIAIFSLIHNAAPYEQMPELFSTVNYDLESTNQISIDIKQLRIKDLSKVIFKQTDLSTSLYTTIYKNKFIVCNSKNTLLLYMNELANSKTKKCSYNNFSDFGYYINTKLLLDSYFRNNNIYSKSFTNMTQQILSKTGYILGEGLFSGNKILIQGSVRLH